MMALRRKNTQILRLLRRLLMRERTADVHSKLEAMRASAKYEFPAADIDQMLKEIEMGYRDRCIYPEQQE
jgi:hypothetical protein